MTIDLLTFSRNIYPEQLGWTITALAAEMSLIANGCAEYVDQVLSYAHDKVTQHANSPDLHFPAAQTHLLNLLLAPIKTYVSLFTSLALPHYLPLLHAQTYQTRRAVAGQVARSLLQAQTPISSIEHLDGVLDILQVLIKEAAPPPPGYVGVQAQRRGVETEETIEEQGWLARMVHLIYSPDNDVQFQVGSRYMLDQHVCLLTLITAPATYSKSVRGG